MNADEVAGTGEEGWDDHTEACLCPMISTDGVRQLTGPAPEGEQDGCS
ncbi:MAG: hypothetical protein OJF50_000998 [Nitrospira sp.]|nr:hypothetical protein [Nitrospira sp.]